MKRGWSIGGTLLAAALAQAAPAEERGAQPSLTAQSSFSETGEGEDYVARIVNATFATGRLYAPDGSGARDMVYEQRIDSTARAAAEGTQSELRVTARSDGKTLWTIHDSGNEGAAFGDYYRTTEWGCCGAENTMRSYFAWTGKLAFTATADPLFLTIPNTSTRRAIAYLSAYSVAGIEGEKYPRGTGLIALVDGDRTVDLVLLESDEGTGFEWTPKLALADPTGAHAQSGDSFDLWPADGNPDPAGLTGVDLVLGWDADGQAAIPVAAGTFDLAHARLPAGMTARHLPPK
ncbi:MAG: hypothetical protein P0Y56_09585 [Candidatus Andeanibacterium colombiense]|uniref:Uncharacterized protein n=1 Tax=Candidatus Andeanibacterium colombiense TaxID=3121345 RepID=A0AAJ5X653_9SPHN|nr:MAG: hypothetical protein P0Y56_09585 [Sphingomonadaceae bacterium]